MNRLITVTSFGILAFFSSFTASAQDYGAKKIHNRTTYPIVVEAALRSSLSSGTTLITNGVKYITLPPGESQNFTYRGPFLNAVRVTGQIQCDVTAISRGDAADNLLNMNSVLIVEPHSSGCAISTSRR